MSKSNFSDVTRAMGLIAESQYEQAMALMSRMAGHRDPNVLRFFYTIHSRPGSPYRDPNKAIKVLDELVGMSDPWSITEKGRCLLQGDLYNINVAEAEDHLIRSVSRGDDPKAEYYIGLIYANGYHVVDGSPVFDKPEAIRIFSGLQSKQSPYRELAELEYCRLMVDDYESLSTDTRATIMGKLLVLSEKGKDSAMRLYGRLLVAELTRLSNKMFDKSNSTQPAQSLQEMMEQSKLATTVNAGLCSVSSIFLG